MLFNSNHINAAAIFMYLLDTQDRLVGNAELARELGVSKHYLQQVLCRMSRNGFIKTQKGPRGGYQLTQKGIDTPLFEVIKSAAPIVVARTGRLASSIAKARVEAYVYRVTTGILSTMRES